jgi:biopolymer transport protein ExbD
MRVIVNVVPESQRALVGGMYLVEKDAFAADPAGIAALAERLRREKAVDPDLRVLIRAARDERYERVHPAMQAVTLAGVRGVDLVTVPPEGEVERMLEREQGEAGGSP